MAQVGADANLASLRMTNPPHHVWVGANLYHRALLRSRAEVRRIQRERKQG